MNDRFHLRFITTILLLFYLSTVNLVPHSGSTLCILFALAGIVLIVRSGNNAIMTAAEKSVLWMFALYPAVYLISFLINTLQGDLTHFTLKHLEDEFRMLLLIPIYFLFRKLRITESVIWNGILAGAIVSGVYAIVYFFANAGSRVRGAYDAIAFGDIALILAAMSVTATDALCKTHRMYKYIIPIAFLLGLVACILSGTRGTWAAIPVLFAIEFVYMGKYIDLRKRLTLLAAGGSIIIGSYCIPATNVAQRVDSAVSEISDYLKGDVRYGGATVRLLGFRAAMGIFLEDPIIGAGPGNYRPLVDQMIARGELHAMTAQHSQPSSTLLSTLATCGVLGLIALMGIFIAPLRYAIMLIRSHPDHRSIGYSLMTLVVGFFLFGVSEIIFRRSFYSSFYIILIAAFMALAANIRDNKLNKFHE